MLADLEGIDMARYYNGTSESKAAKCLIHDHIGNINKSDRPSGIILASGCLYLGMPGNPPERWVEYPPSGAHVHEAWPCDTSAGGAASQIYLGNQSEPKASPNPAGESSASLPVIAPRFITDGVNEKTDSVKPEKQKKTRKAATTNTAEKYQTIQICIYLFRRGDWERTLILGT